MFLHFNLRNPFDSANKRSFKFKRQPSFKVHVLLASHLQRVLQFNLVLTSRWLREAGNVILFMKCLPLSCGQRNEKGEKSFVTSSECFSRENAFNQMKILSQGDAV